MSEQDDEHLSIFSLENRANIPVYPLDVFTPTKQGEAEIHGHATKLPPEALELLVLMDGKASVGDLEFKAPHIAPEALRNVLRSLLAGGLIRAATIAESEGLDFSAYFDEPRAEASAGTKASAEREAASGTPLLEKEGYYVSIARTAVQPHPAAAGAKRTALVVEDDPDVAALVERLLAAEGFDVAKVMFRAEVLERLRKTPSPDVVVLDVILPDINGFDLLKAIKQHPKLKAVPVIMLTAQATREAVMRGLVGGADGYITKPFERDALRDGVKAVLGIG